VGIEDRQEGGGHQQRRHETDAAVEEAAAGDEGEPDRDGADQGHDHAAGQKEAAAVRDVADQPVRLGAPVLHGENRLQQIGEQGRVVHVVGIQAAGVEHADRLADVDPLLVDLVGEGQPVLEPPEAQRQRQQQDPPEGQHPGLDARALEAVVQGRRQGPGAGKSRQARED
jgi:hypothetical protein